MESSETAASDLRSENPVQRVLRLPELLPEIFEHLDRAALSAAVRVNRAWAAGGIPILWRYPTRKALGALPAKRCRAFDASIRGVEMRVMLKRPTGKKPWALPRLQRLTCAYRDLAAERPKMLAALQRHAATLTHVVVNSYRSSRSRRRTSSSSGNSSNSGSNGSVLSIAHRGWCCVLGSSDLLVAAAACRRLVHLQLDYEITAGAMRDFVRHAAQQAQPFSLLRTLRARVAAAALPALCTTLGRVEELALAVVDGYQFSNDHVFTALSGLRSIQKLEVATDDVVHGQKLEPLALLTELEVLCIWRRGPLFSSDEAFASVTSRLCRLRILTLPESEGLSDSAYAVAGRNCPQLTYLELNARCDVRHLRYHDAGGRPLFPMLDTLSINELKRARKLPM